MFGDNYVHQCVFTVKLFILQTNNVLDFWASCYEMPAHAVVVFTCNGKSETSYFVERGLVHFG